MDTEKKNRGLLLLIVSIVAGVLVAAFITGRLFAGDTFEVILQNMTTTPDWQYILFVNGLVGVSVTLFIHQLGWVALRVTVTVLVALLLGYIMTGFFNLDNASRLTRGEFKVALVSEAEKVQVEGMDIEYGRERGDEFNIPNAREPLNEASYRFQGKRADVVTVLAYAANRRSEVDLQVTLLNEQGEILASAMSSTLEQLEKYSDMRTEKDAAIENFMLPADGVYLISVRPEALATGTILSEAVAGTNLAYEAFLFGALERVNRWAVWIQDALTLILVGLAISIVFRARQFSLGAEGQLYFGALISGVICLSATGVPLVVVMVVAVSAAMLAGFLWGLVPGILKAYLGANELVSSLMLNTIMIRFFELVLTFQLKPPDAGYIASAPFPIAGQMPVLIAGTQVTIAVFMVIVAVAVVWLLITRTALGYEIRTIGANLKFADYGGINTKRTIMLTMAVSGLVAGSAGAHLGMGIFRQLLLNMSVQLAFQGVVVTLLARNNPLVIPFTGLLYAYLRAGAQFMERDANISFEVVGMIQAVIILLITAEALAGYFQNRRKQGAALPQNVAAQRSVEHG